ncbi:hypothetical protein B9Q03_09485 [Candidatus Marsarchaeota G2 archaeon OSP_D]|jgi:hypothetical protein|uniref:Uncharacterized protein n=1 Tax=Candidatus Marsarchaeota G2 archaeon OSP_D TaxID=1978157 RepID=A0A2R6APD5_9ARCH|nr:MAG: hypothetical protein B9Q03_09485 [Candidatus Marsarchaeota G2 archaeon OSP_D]
MGRSTFGELCRITYLTREDLERIFLKLPMALMLENKSDVRALRDLLMCLLDGSREPEVIIKRLLKQVSELKEAGFDYEARLKALCQVAEERGLVDAGFIGLVGGFWVGGWRLVLGCICSSLFTPTPEMCASCMKRQSAGPRGYASGPRPNLKGLKGVDAI